MGGGVAGGAGGAKAAREAVAGLAQPKVNLLDTPADLAGATGDAQEERIRYYLGDDVPKAQELDAVVILTRTEEDRPTARVWSRRSTDDTVSRCLTGAMEDGNPP